MSTILDIFFTLSLLLLNYILLFLITYEHVPIRLILCSIRSVLLNAIQFRCGKSIMD